MSRDLDWRDELSAHSVEIDGDRDLLLLFSEALPCELFLSLLLVHPFEVDIREVCLQSLSELETVFFS